MKDEPITTYKGLVLKGDVTTSYLIGKFRKKILSKFFENKIGTKQKLKSMLNRNVNTPTIKSCIKKKWDQTKCITCLINCTT